MTSRTLSSARQRIDPHTLFEYLPVGRKRAKTADAICRHFGIATAQATENQKRLVRFACEKASRLGYLICADEYGYYKPKHAAEVKRTALRFKAQIRNMSIRLRQFERLTQKRFNRRLEL